MGLLLLLLVMVLTLLSLTSSELCFFSTTVHYSLFDGALGRPTLLPHLLGHPPLGALHRPSVVAWRF